MRKRSGREVQRSAVRLWGNAELYSGNSVLQQSKGCRVQLQFLRAQCPVPTRKTRSKGIDRHMLVHLYIFSQSRVLQCGQFHHSRTRREKNEKWQFEDPQNLWRRLKLQEANQRKPFKTKLSWSPIRSRAALTLWQKAAKLFWWLFCILKRSQRT